MRITDFDEGWTDEHLQKKFHRGFSVRRLRTTPHVLVLSRPLHPRPLTFILAENVWVSVPLGERP